MKITDEALYQHVAEARDIWLDTLPKDDELPEHQFSDGFMSSLETMEVQEKAQHMPGWKYMIMVCGMEWIQRRTGWWMTDI